MRTSVNSTKCPSCRTSEFVVASDQVHGFTLECEKCHIYLNILAPIPVSDIEARPLRMVYTKSYSPSGSYCVKSGYRTAIEGMFPEGIEQYVSLVRKPKETRFIRTAASKSYARLIAAD